MQNWTMIIIEIIDVRICDNNCGENVKLIPENHFFVSFEILCFLFSMRKNQLHLH